MRLPMQQQQQLQLAQQAMQSGMADPQKLANAAQMSQQMEEPTETPTE